MRSIDSYDLSSPVDRYLSSLDSEESYRTQKSKLKSAAMLLGFEDENSVNWSAVGYEKINLLIRQMQRMGRKRNTVNTTLSAIKGVYSELMRMKSIEIHDYQLIKEIKSIKGDDSKIGKALTSKEIKELFIENPTRPIEFRNNAILAVLIGCGLRRIEVTRLESRNVNINNGKAHLSVKGKGGKVRKVYIPEFALHHIKTWIEDYSLGGDSYLFSPINRYDHISDKMLKTQTVYEVVKSRAKNAAPHDFRRTFISRLLELNNDLSTVQKIAGHANPATTVRYDKRDDRQQEEAISKLRY